MDSLRRVFWLSAGYNLPLGLKLFIIREPETVLRTELVGYTNPVVGLNFKTPLYPRR